MKKIFLVLLVLLSHNASSMHKIVKTHRRCISNICKTCKRDFKLADKLENKHYNELNDTMEKFKGFAKNITCFTAVVSAVAGYYLSNLSKSTNKK